MNLRFSAPSSDDVTSPDSRPGVSSEPSNVRPTPESARGEAAPQPLASGPWSAPAGTVTSTVPTYALPASSADAPSTRPYIPTPTDLQQTVIVEDASLSEMVALPEAAATPSPPPPAATAEPQPSVEPTPPPAPAPGTGQAQPRSRKLQPKQRRRVRLKHILPAWSVSLIVHLVIFTALGAATFSDSGADVKPVNIDTALAGFDRSLEETPILADPVDDRPEQLGDMRDDVPRPNAEAAWADEQPDLGSMIASVSFPSTTPSLRGTVARSDKEQKLGPSVSLGGLKRSPISQLPANPASDLYSGGNFGGDPIFGVTEIGDALNQLTHEILNHLADHKVTVVWLFDESSSMKDDQREIAKKFDRVTNELNKFISPDKKAIGALNHAIVGFGDKVDFVLEKPTTDVEVIRSAMKKLRVDDTGAENTMRAIRETVNAYSRLVDKDRKLLLVLITDESGDDGADVEEALQVLKKYNTPLYVIGRQAVFGYPFAHHKYVDPVTKDVYHPTIRRGPESADVEAYQWDGLYDRWDEQPSGFAPWELARLTKGSGGIYFLLPSEEFMRIRQREKAYSITQLKEFMPEYMNRTAYVQRRTESDLRRSLYLVVSETREFRYRREFPIEPQELMSAAQQEGGKASERLAVLLEIQKRLETLKKHREREPERRWRAHYDLMLAQTVVFQIKAYEYRALMAQLAQAPQKPTKAPTRDVAITFVVDHAAKGLAPETETAKKYAEAKRLLGDVIAEYPDTPWADLAKDSLTRGFSVILNQWEHSPNYQERGQYVPKY